VQKYFDTLNYLGVAHVCVRRTDGIAGKGKRGFV